MPAYLGRLIKVSVIVFSAGLLVLQARQFIVSRTAAAGAVQDNQKLADALQQAAAQLSAAKAQLGAANAQLAAQARLLMAIQSSMPDDPGRQESLIQLQQLFDTLGNRPVPGI